MPCLSVLPTIGYQFCSVLSHAAQVLHSTNSNHMCPTRLSCLPVFRSASMQWNLWLDRTSKHFKPYRMLTSSWLVMEQSGLTLPFSHTGWRCNQCHWAVAWCWSWQRSCHYGPEMLILTCTMFHLHPSSTFTRPCNTSQRAIASWTVLNLGKARLAVSSKAPAEACKSCIHKWSRYLLPASAPNVSKCIQRRHKYHKSEICQAAQPRSSTDPVPSVMPSKGRPLDDDCELESANLKG